MRASREGILTFSCFPRVSRREDTLASAAPMVAVRDAATFRALAAFSLKEWSVVVRLFIAASKAPVSIGC